MDIAFVMEPFYTQIARRPSAAAAPGFGLPLSGSRDILGFRGRAVVARR